MRKYFATRAAGQASQTPRKLAGPDKFNRDFKMITRQQAGKPVGPFQRGRGPPIRLFQAQFGQFTVVLYPVQIRMNQGNPPWVFIDQREGGTGDMPVRGDAKSQGDPLDQRCFAAAQRTNQADDIADLQNTPEARARRPGFLGARAFEPPDFFHFGFQPRLRVRRR